jgi:hypothetical protein
VAVQFSARSKISKVNGLANLVLYNFVKLVTAQNLKQQRKIDAKGTHLWRFKNQKRVKIKKNWGSITARGSE